MASIEFNYGKAISQANRLDGVASDMKRLANNSMSGSLRDVNAAWTGENATAYIQKGNILREQIDETAAELQQIAESIKKVAERMKQAEDFAKSVIG